MTPRVRMANLGVWNTACTGTNAGAVGMWCLFPTHSQHERLGRKHQGKKVAELAGFPQLPLPLLHSSRRRVPALPTVPGTWHQAFACNSLGTLAMEIVVTFSPQGWAGGQPFLLPLLRGCVWIWVVLPALVSRKAEDVQESSASSLCALECLKTSHWGSSPRKDRRSKHIGDSFKQKQRLLLGINKRGKKYT